MKTVKVSKQNRPIGMDTANAARYVGVSPSLLRKFRQNGEGPAYAKIGAKVIYRKTDLKKYLKKSLIL